MSFLENLANLPDRPVLEQLSRALWSRGTLGGAAVLVGAGVSRGGVQLFSNDAPLPPLWSDLAVDMERELYGALQSPNAPRDPLRLAEEFRTGLGDAALTDFLRHRIRDDTFEPGSIHRDLLDLPWADVLTTNYDTLLERASQNANRGYNLVLTESDLPHARGPRIIKLHGSLRDGADVVISEEDYRTYPQRRAAFVNTARQVFIENELCLLGFSGDDPNFLQWAGWVRDRLSSRARRIYLVGALDLPPVKRRLLEARGIAPIDLAPAVTSERKYLRHKAAIAFFLAHLKSARPTEPDQWKPESSQSYPNLLGSPETRFRDFRNPAKVVQALRAASTIWQKDRQACPDWLVCPPSVRLSLRHGIQAVDNLSLALETLDEKERRDALLELAWRHDRGALRLPSLLAEQMDAISTPQALAESDPELVRALARTLLGAARVADNETALANRAARFESLAAISDLPALVAYERCLFARDRLDFDFVAENASKVDGDDPVWGLRRAALLYWVGETEEALRSIGASTRELRARVLRDPDSVALRSRLAWTKTLASALRWEDDGRLFAELEGLDRLALRDYDPWEQLRAIDADINEGLRKRSEARQIDPGFDAGTYSDNRDTVTFSDAAQVTPLSELRHIAERVGLPIRAPHVNVLGTRLADALRLAFEPTTAWHSAFLSTKPSYSKGPIDIHLGRIPLARLDAATVAKLRERLEGAAAFWRARVRKGAKISDVDVLRLYVEALSRLTARDDIDAAKAHVCLAVELGCDEGLTHGWMDEPIGHLLKRALDAVPFDERGALSSELLRFPLAAERGENSRPMSWYNPGPDAYRFVRRSGNEAVFDSRVAEFIQHLADGGPSRPEAALRLIHLHEKEQLTADQISSFGEALWKGIPQESNALPEGTNLLSHAFLIAPAPPEIDARARVYAQLFGLGEGATPDHLVMGSKGRTPNIRPREEDAARLFQNVTAWRPEKPDSGSVGDALARPAREEKGRMKALILGTVAAPALMQDDRTVQRAQAALTFLEETDIPETLSALPVFYGKDADVDRRIENAFRRPLAMGDRRATSAAVGALDCWLYLSETDQTLPPMPDVLCDRALRALERGRMVGHAHLIYLAGRLVEAGRFDNPALDRIIEVLDELREATEYGPPDGEADVESDRAVSLPLVRAECVRLARALERKGVTTEPVRAWLDLAVRDPLPEVRGAARDLMDK